MDTLTLDGTYTHGLGKAHKAFKEPNMAGSIIGSLGSHMEATFNIEVELDSYRQISELNGKSGFLYRRGPIEPTKYYLCELVHNTGLSAMGWVFQWKALPEKKNKKYSIELLSRELVPDIFKDGEPFTVNLYSKWEKQKIGEWWPKQPHRWFQSFDWGSKRGDGYQVWRVLNKAVNWEDQRILDIGCNTGWYSFMAAHRGASVYGYDKEKVFVDTANTIARHIEYVDVNFGMEDPGGDFDIIFYLSVHHMIDKNYDHLEETIEAYRKRCKTLLIELSAPPPSGGITREATCSKVDGEELHCYKHKIRCNRTIWKIDGYLA